MLADGGQQGKSQRFSSPTPRNSTDRYPVFLFRLEVTPLTGHKRGDPLSSPRALVVVRLTLWPLPSLAFPSPFFLLHPRSGALGVTDVHGRPFFATARVGSLFPPSPPFCFPHDRLSSPGTFPPRMKRSLTVYELLFVTSASWRTRWQCKAADTTRRFYLVPRLPFFGSFPFFLLRGAVLHDYRSR